MTDEERQEKFDSAFYNFTQELQCEFNSRVYGLLGELIDEYSYKYGIERNDGLDAEFLVDLDTELTVNEDEFHLVEDEEEQEEEDVI